ncbi:MAG TPA: substrate-binding domain-containing protein [Conexibacter sp.]|nr:substrate-binding domain-containing protein [Conexibacter sp.]
MKARNLIALAVAALLLVPATAGAVTLIGSGSTAAEPFYLALFKGYKKVRPDVKFVYTADGGNAGVKDVQQGKSQFAGNARPPLPSDAGTTYVKGFLDGLCIVVNPANKLTNITTAQTRDIYTGVTTNWSSFPKSRLHTTIAPVGRDSNGGTYNFFLQSVLNNAPPASTVNALLSDGLVANAVQTNPNAIGYNGLAYVQGNSTLKALSLDGVPCAPANVKTLEYPLSRYIFFVLPQSNPNADVEKFIDWVRTSPEAGAIIAKTGGVPAFNKAAPVKCKKGFKKKKSHGKVKCVKKKKAKKRR